MRKDWWSISIVVCKCILMGSRILLRSSDQKKTWVKIDTTLDHAHGGRQMYIDSTLPVGQEVIYQVLVRDSSGNITMSNIAEGRRIDSKIRPAPTSAVIQWDAQNQHHVLSWQYAPRKDVQAIRIYRSNMDVKSYYTFKYLALEDLSAKTIGQLIQYEYLIPMDQKDESHVYSMRIDFRDGAQSKTANFVMKN